MKKFGTSLSTCILDIINGKTSLEDVTFVLSAIQIKDKDALHDLLASVFTLKNLAQAYEIGEALWDSGRIFSPSVRQEHRTPVSRWIKVGDVFVDT